jgi:DNA-binding winged helix-turn-helix (wHTH) protein
MKGKPVQAHITLPTDSRRTGMRVIGFGIAGIIALLVVTAGWLLLTLPDARAFDARVEQLFIENAELTSPTQIKLLEILAQSGTAFADTLAGYRMVITVLLVFAAAMLIAAMVCLVLFSALTRRMAKIEQSGIQVNSLIVSRQERTVYVNTMGFKLTEAAMETLSVLAEARMDDDILSGVELEAIISGRASEDCDESAGATRIKRLRDALGNQIVAALLVKTIAKQGYMLAIDKQVIRVV